MKRLFSLFPILTVLHHVAQRPVCFFPNFFNIFFQCPRTQSRHPSQRPHLSLLSSVHKAPSTTCALHWCSFCTFLTVSLRTVISKLNAKAPQTTMHPSTASAKRWLDSHVATRYLGARTEMTQLSARGCLKRRSREKWNLFKISWASYEDMSVKTYASPTSPKINPSLADPRNTTDTGERVPALQKKNAMNNRKAPFPADSKQSGATQCCEICVRMVDGACGGSLCDRSRPWSIG